MSNIAAKWNILDTFIYKVESALHRKSSTFKENQNRLPDAETMIDAATSYLKEENRKLKELSYPRQVIESDKGYFCPNSKCHFKIPDILVEQYKIKYCIECGQRIFQNRLKRKLKEYLQKHMEENQLNVIDSKKAEMLSRVIGFQLPQALITSSYNKNISYQNEKVNRKKCR